MIDITSTNNRQVVEIAKLHQKKYRSSTGLFLLEGFKPISEAYASGIEIQIVLTDEAHKEKYNFANEKIKTVNEAVLKKLSTTDSPAEAVAVGLQRQCPVDGIRKLSKIALLENIKDAGNLGTIIRSAAAFGIEAIILCGDCIDLYNPKVVRSTAGNLFKIPIIKLDSIKNLREIFPEKVFIATVVNHDEILQPEQIDFSKPFILMLGSEAEGLTNEAINTSDIKTTIPISENVESLNLSIAASVLFYIAGKHT